MIERKAVPIMIDGKEYQVAEGDWTLPSLRAMVLRGTDYDCFQEIPDQSDRQITISDIVKITGGERFYFVPLAYGA